MSVIVLARIAVETTSPLAIYSGRRDQLSNNALARDWNGLPYLPATAVAGVWRNAVTDIDATGINPIRPDRWFGSIRSGNANERMASRVIVSDGLLLNSHSKLPGSGKEDISFRALCDKEDPVYDLVSGSADRDYERPGCRINARKANHNRGLFKSKTLPKGLRFAFDVKFELDDRDDIETCRYILSKIASDSFVMGSKTANGLGAFKVISCRQQEFDLKDYANRPNELAQAIRGFVLKRQISIGEEANLIAENEPEAGRTWEFTLASEGTMRLGTGRNTSGLTIVGSNGVKEIELLEYEKGLKFEDRNIQRCFTDTRLEWNGNDFTRKVSEFIVPGSTIKGIIAHRTMYHFLRRKKWFATNVITQNGESPQDLINRILENKEPPEEFEPFYDLFGRNDPTNHDRMQAGALKVSDAVVDCASIVNRMHNKIDRYTGGVMPSALFGQARLVDPSFRVRIGLSRKWLELRQENLHDDSEIMKALDDTIYDLKNGFLNICAGSGRDTAVFYERKEDKQA
ncbi:MAG: hypothetical protein IJ523_11235 [Succinivibrionaceae bacterium]|nr:hypothetical protein [Succinivibrionaceae bacterium]